MYEDTRTAKLVKALGKPSGPIGALLFRNVNGKQVISGMPSDYHVPTDEHSIEKMEAFGASGIIARQINLHPILKNIWLDYCKIHRKSYYSIYNEITRSLHRVQKCSRYKQFGIRSSEFGMVSNQCGMRNAECGMESHQEAGSFFENMRLVPGSRYISHAQIFMFNGEVYVKPADDEVWDAAAGIITGWQPRQNPGPLQVKGKCKVRNTERRRKQKVRDRLFDIDLSLKAIAQAVRWLEDFAGLQFLGYIIPSVCQLSENFREDAAKADPLSVNISFGRHGGKRHFEDLLADLKELLNLDYLPCRETLDELTAELMIEERRIREEDIRLSAEYKAMMEAEPKYMHKRIAAAPIQFERLENGYFKMVRDESTEEIYERFEKVSIHIVMYLQDEEGYALQWTDTIFITIETEDFYRFKLISALLQIHRRMRSAECGVRNVSLLRSKEGQVFRRCNFYKELCRPAGALMRGETDSYSIPPLRGFVVEATPPIFA